MSAAASTHGVTETLGAFVAGLAIERIPPDIIARAKACFVDTLGVALAGSATRVAAAMRAHVGEHYAAGPASLIGGLRRVGAIGAALANATAAHALDFDDNCYAGSVHASAVVAPSALAACQMADRGGAACLAAFVAGFEVECTLGRAVTDTLYARGWFNTPLLGALGAAASAASALRLDANAAARALAFATTATGGLKASFGSDSKPVLAGRAAALGVEAALLAARGLTAPRQAWEEARGFARMFNEGLLCRAAVDEIGQTWNLLTPGIDVKRLPVCLSAQAAADALQQILARHGLDAGDVVEVLCDVPAAVGRNLTYTITRDPQQAQFSLNFALGCILTFGTIGLAHLDPEVLADPSLQRAMAVVRMVTSERWARDPELNHTAPEGAEVRVTTRDGRRHSAFVAAARGTAGCPLTPAELDAKFLECAGRVLPAHEGRRLRAHLWSLETVADVGVLFPACDRLSRCTDA